MISDFTGGGSSEFSCSLRKSPELLPDDQLLYQPQVLQLTLPAESMLAALLSSMDNPASAALPAVRIKAISYAQPLILHSRLLALLLDCQPVCTSATCVVCRIAAISDLGDESWQL